MITNYSNIPLPLAVWLAADDYDYDLRPEAISATSIMKPIKSLVLSAQMTAQQPAPDLQDLIPSRMGTAIHDAIEAAWKSSKLTEIFMRLGYPKHIAEKIRINPSQAEIDEDNINIWMEQRAEKELDGFIVTGKFDLVMEWMVQDYKSTGTYNWISGSNDEKYKLQLSIYRWLNPNIIRESHAKIHFIFTDWSALKARADKNYPKHRTMERTIELHSLADTEQYLKSRLDEIKKYWGKPEDELPECTPKELWQRPTTWAYYKNPASTGRATKVFKEDAGETIHDANTRRLKDGGKGLVITRPGEVKFCRYCNARPICKQAERYQAAGLLVL